MDDVVQQVWLNVWKRAETLQHPKYWRTWLFRLARNSAIDNGRKQTRRKGLWQRFTERLAGQDLTVPSTAQRGMELQERHSEVLDAIEQLSAIYREPFILRHLEDWSYKQISEALNLPINTVEIRLVRARRKLRAILSPPAEPSETGES